MQEYEVIATGKRQDGTNWARIKKEENGFVQRAFVSPIEMPEVGDQLAVPTNMTLEWTA